MSQINPDGRPNLQDYSDYQLQDFLESIDAEKFPELHSDCINEIQRRKSEGKWSERPVELEQKWEELPFFSRRWLFAVNLPGMEIIKISYPLIHYKIFNFGLKTVMGSLFTISGFLGLLTLITQPSHPDREIGFLFCLVFFILGLAFLFMKPIYPVPGKIKGKNTDLM